MIETRVQYTIQAKRPQGNWEPVEIDRFGKTALLAITDDLQQAQYKLSSLKEYARTYHSHSEYRIIKATTTFEVLDA